MVEIWKNIECLKGFYEVSNLGRVRSLNKEVVKNQFAEGRILKQRTNTYGYKIVNVWVNGKRHTYLVHRLVAKAFIPNPNKLPQINHIDEDKSNNIVANLEWCTAKYNDNYGTRTKRIVQTRDSAKSRHRIRVSQYTLNNEYIKTYDSLIEASKKTGISQGSIGHVIRHERHHAGGFVWIQENN